MTTVEIRNLLRAAGRGPIDGPGCAQLWQASLLERQAGIQQYVNVPEFTYTLSARGAQWLAENPPADTPDARQRGLDL